MTGDQGDGLGKLVLGGAVGFGLYLLVTGLGFGGLGSGGDGGGRSDGRGEGKAPSPKVPPLPPKAPPDKQAIMIVVRPSPTDPQRAVIVMDGRTVSVGELIARIDAGGRDDALVTVTGDTVQGAWDEIHDALQFAGIRIFMRQKAGATVSGNTRGQYGMRWSAA